MGSSNAYVQGGHYWNQANLNHAPFIASGPAAWNPGNERVFRNFLPSSAGYGHGEGGAGKPGSRAIYGDHSHVGTMIYLGNNWPGTYRGQLFTHNLHGHQMNQQKNQRQGSGYKTTHAGSDHFYTTDPRFIGVDLKYGPDGAVYMIDWADKQHCHTNNVDSWDRSDGRLYRMAWDPTYKPNSVDLRSESTAELVALVTDQDEWRSRIARRLLQERQDRAALPLLDRALSGPHSTPAYLRLLWTRHLLDSTATPEGAFNHKAEDVRAWAIALRGDGQRPPVSRLIETARNDSSPMVRLAVASALQRIETSNRLTLDGILADKKADHDDVYLPKLIWYGLAAAAKDHPAEVFPSPPAPPCPFWPIPSSGT
ncbi:MAG: hypothetical protein AAF514_09040 [Verrucomicrobiota bacterium]